MTVLQRVLAAAIALAFAGGAATAASAQEDEVEEVFTFTDPEIVESSGLAVSDGLFVTVNDSGDRARTFVIDPRTGETVGGVSFGDAVDIEALALAPNGEVWVGDLGGNVEERAIVEVTRVAFERGQTQGASRALRLTYPDGATDAEALLVHPKTGRMLVADKKLFSGTLYMAPKNLGAADPLPLRAVADVIQNVTGGSFFPSGDHLILRNYTSAAVYTYPGFELVDTFVLPAQKQGESIAVSPSGEVFISTEGQFTSVLRVELPEAIAAEVYGEPGSKPSPGSVTFTKSPDPSITDAPPVPEETGVETFPDGEADPQDDESAGSSDDADRPLWPLAIILVTFLTAAGLILASRTRP